VICTEEPTFKAATSLAISRAEAVTVMLAIELSRLDLVVSPENTDQPKHSQMLDATIDLLISKLLITLNDA
jgi:hypothetical protein